MNNDPEHAEKGEANPLSSPHIRQTAAALDPAELLACSRIVKDSRSTKAGIVEGFFVKRYNHRGFLHTVKKIFQIPRPYRCRKTALHLAAHHIPTPEVIFVNRMFLVTEAVDAVFGNRQTPSLETLAHTLRALHKAGVYHGDTSMRNFYFTSNPGQLGIIDLDGSKVYRKIPHKAVQKDIARAVSSYMLVSGITQQERAPELVKTFMKIYTDGDSTENIPGYILKRINHLLQRSRT